ncbi:putative ABC transporter permease [Clostridiales bacterium BX7]|uniref:ABC transporter permease n=1 Tax=Feifania hominis TaxID=2763660 RepID=A0A926HUQ8_9FIRM|nr:putative ABC transporter permease [Feifania hominis]MBC8535821.1 putative ABC transporter permease [Feifania hominis]
MRYTVVSLIEGVAYVPAQTELWFLYFLLYSVLGWCCEVVYCSIPAKKFINRGFLYGPLCPIYGCGALLGVWLLEPVAAHPLAVFALGLLVMSALEYVTSVLMEWLFHARWWDYSNHRFHLNGRVCLTNSILFGLMAVAVIYFIHPLVVWFIGLLPDGERSCVALVLFTVLVVDITLTVRSLIDFRATLARFRAAAAEFGEKWELSAEKWNERLAEWRAEHPGNPELDEFRQRLRERFAELPRFEQFSFQRLLRAFPRMSSKRWAEGLETFKQAAADRLASLRAERAHKRRDRKKK